MITPILWLVMSLASFFAMNYVEGASWLSDLGTAGHLISYAFVAIGVWCLAEMMFSSFAGVGRAWVEKRRQRRIDASPQSYGDRLRDRLIEQEYGEALRYRRLLEKKSKE